MADVNTNLNANLNTNRGTQADRRTGHERRAVLRVATAADALPVHKHISWGAIVGGVIVAAAIQLMLGLFGIGVGASVINPTQSPAPLRALGLVAALWWVLSSLLATFSGAFVAGRLAGERRRLDGMLHGLIAWGVMAIVMFFIVTSSAGGLVGGALSVVGRGVNASMLASGIAAGEGDASAQREDLVKALVERGGLDRDEAETTVDAWLAQRAQTRQLGQTVTDQARIEGERTAEGVARAANWSGLAMLLGAVVAALGGAIGVRRRL